MKKIFLLLLTLLSLNAQSQTHVKGSILTNTTWTKASSPYIVDSSVTVFPNITLTIEPGVSVKFADSTYLSIEQASLIADGTASDSITFTSNSLTPIQRIWYGVGFDGDTGNASVNLNYCNFKYANVGIDAGYSSLNIKNSNFNNNTYGIYSYYNDSSDAMFNIDSCTFNSNYFGFYGGFGTYITNSKFFNDSTGIYQEQGFISLKGCNISNNEQGFYCENVDNVFITSCIIDSNINNGINIFDFPFSSYAYWRKINIYGSEINANVIGIETELCYTPLSVVENVITYNTIGIHIRFDTAKINIQCNKICNNTSYDFSHTEFWDISAPNNYWCSSDSAVIQSHIYDKNDSALFGLVTFMPIDTIGCYMITGVAGYEINDLPVSVYPNPASNQLFIHASLFHDEVVMVSVMNVLGQEASASTRLQRGGENAVIDVSGLPSGMYFLLMKSENGSIVRKFVKE